MSIVVDRVNIIGVTAWTSMELHNTLDEVKIKTNEAANDYREPFGMTIRHSNRSMQSKGIGNR